MDQRRNRAFSTETADSEAFSTENAHPQKKTLGQWAVGA
jgi:hypothetical protein